MEAGPVLTPEPSVFETVSLAAKSGQAVKGGIFDNLSGYTLTISCVDGVKTIGPWGKDFIPVAASTPTVVVSFSSGQIGDAPAPTVITEILYSTDAVPPNLPQTNSLAVVNSLTMSGTVDANIISGNVGLTGPVTVGSISAGNVTVDNAAGQTGVNLANKYANGIFVQADYNAGYTALVGVVGEAQVGVGTACISNQSPTGSINVVVCTYGFTEKYLQLVVPSLQTFTVPDLDAVTPNGQALYLYTSPGTATNGYVWFTITS